MTIALDMNKSAEKLKLCLEKAGVGPGITADVAFALDVSGSYEDEHRDGSTNLLMARMVPWGLVFDPDKKLDVFTFSNDLAGVHYVGEVTERNYSDYVQKNIIGMVPGWKGGTHYSFVLERALQHFGWLPNPHAPQQKKPGFLAKMLGAKDPEPEQVTAPRRSLIIVNTDGDNTDKDRTIRVLQESQDRGDLAYFLFLGYSNQGNKFPFLQQIGDRFDNTALVTIENLQTFAHMSDEQLNELLIGDELLKWLKK